MSATVTISRELSNRRLVTVAIVTWFVLILLSLYFKYFPIIVNEPISNALVLVFIAVFAASATYGAFLVKNERDTLFLLPQTLLFVFFIRAIPNVRLAYPPLQDPYFGFVQTTNIVTYGTLNPVLAWWGSLLNLVTYLHWPANQLIGATIIDVTNIDLLQVLKFQEPLLGIVFFLGVFILTKTIFDHIGLAFTAALIASCVDTVIFYQGEFHSQGLALVYFPFLLYLMIKSLSADKNRSIFAGLLAALLVVLAVTHHYSLIILGLFGMAYLLLIFLLILVPPLRNWVSASASDLRWDAVVWLTILVVGVIINVFVFPSFIQGLLAQFIQPGSGSVVTFGTQVPWSVTALNLIKWVLLLLALPSIVYFGKSGNLNQLRLVISALCVLIAGLISTFVIQLASDRLVGFFAVVMAPFAAYTIFAVNRGLSQPNKTLKRAILLVTVTVLIVGGVFNANTPAYYFHGSGTNTYYFYSNDLSSMSRYGSAGGWIKAYTPPNSRYITEFDTLIVPFYYGQRPFDNEQWFLFVALQSGNVSNQYIVVNPTIPYSFGGHYFDKQGFLKSTSLLYSDGTLVVAYNQSSSKNR